MRTLFTLCTLLLPLSAAIFAQPVPDTLWTRTFGGTSQDWPWGGVQVTPEGDYVLAGAFDWGQGTQTGCMIKMNASGDTIWTRTGLGGNVAAFCQAADGGFLIASDTALSPQNDDAYILRMNAAGQVLWRYSYGGSRRDRAKDIIELPGGDVVFAGYTSSFTADNTNDCYLVKLNAQGDTLWTRTWGGNHNDAISDFLATDDGFLCVGWTDSYGAGQNDYYVAKTDSMGIVQWQYTYGTSSDEVAQNFCETPDQGYLLVGSVTRVAYTTYSIYLVRINAAGDTLWTRTYGTQYTSAMGNDVQAFDNGDAVVVGYASQTPISDIWLLRMNSAGDTLWTRRLDLSGYQTGLSLAQTSDHGYIIAGVTDHPGAPLPDIFVVKTGPDQTSGVEIVLSAFPRSFQFHAYPNPFNAMTRLFFSLPQASTVRLAVYDVAGRSVQTLGGDFYGAGEHVIPFNGSDLPSGVYFARLQSGSVSETQRLILLK